MSRFALAGLAIATTATFGACSSDATGPDDVSGVKLNVFARLGAVSTATVPVSAALAASVAGPVESIEIDEVKIVIGGLKLETAGIDDTEDVTFEDSRVVPLDLTGDPVLVSTYSPIPAGTYKEWEIWVDKLEVGNPAEQTLIDDNPLLADASVLVVGRVVRPDASIEAFSFATDADEDLEILLDPFLTLESPEDGSAPSFTVALVIDVGSWFMDDFGGWLDPTEPADRSAIESNIGDSFDAFEDDDEDGFDD